MDQLSLSHCLERERPALWRCLSSSQTGYDGSEYKNIFVCLFLSFSLYICKGVVVPSSSLPTHIDTGQAGRQAREECKLQSVRERKNERRTKGKQKSRDEERRKRRRRRKDKLEKRKCSCSSKEKTSRPRAFPVRELNVKKNPKVFYSYFFLNRKSSTSNKQRRRRRRQRHKKIV